MEKLIQASQSFQRLHTSMWCNTRCIYWKKIHKYAYSYIWKRKRFQQSDKLQKKIKFQFIHH